MSDVFDKAFAYAMSKCTPEERAKVYAAGGKQFAEELLGKDGDDDV